MKAQNVQKYLYLISIITFFLVICFFIVRDKPQYKPTVVKNSESVLIDVYKKCSHCTVTKTNTGQIKVVMHDEYCKNHYIAKLIGKSIKIYSLNDLDNPQYEFDSPALTSLDAMYLQNGVKLNSKEELESFLEDYSS